LDLSAEAASPQQFVFAPHLNAKPPDPARFAHLREVIDRGKPSAFIDILGPGRNKFRPFLDRLK
jgi:hypothetical protein